MMPSSRRHLTPLMMVVALWPSRSSAQTTGWPDELTGRAKSQDTVIVSGPGGQQVKGALIAIDDNSLTIAMKGHSVRVLRSEIGVVRATEGVGNGALIGAGTGLGAALAILAIIGSGDGYVLPSAKVGAPLLLSSAGAIVGALIDHAHQSGTVLYPQAGQTTGMAIAPTFSVATNRLSVGVSVLMKLN